MPSAELGINTNENSLYDRTLCKNETISLTQFQRSICQPVKDERFQPQEDRFSRTMSLACLCKAKPNIAENIARKDTALLTVDLHPSQVRSERVDQQLHVTLDSATTAYITLISKLT